MTSLEVLGIALRAEMDFQEIYKTISSKCTNDILKEKFLILHNEEKKHQTILENLYRQLCKDIELKIPESQIIKGKFFNDLKQPQNIIEALKYAIDLEKKSKEFYLDCAEIVQDLSGKRMFRYLADMEFNHQMILNAELEMIEKYPTYFETSTPFYIEQSFVKKKE